MAQYHIFVNSPEGLGIGSFINNIEVGNFDDGEWQLEYAAPGYYFETNSQELQDYLRTPIFQPYYIQEIDFS